MSLIPNKTSTCIATLLFPLQKISFPVLTPSMNRPRLRTSNVPVKAAETRLISSLLRDLVPLMVSFQVQVKKINAISSFRISQI